MPDSGTPSPSSPSRTPPPGRRPGSLLSTSGIFLVCFVAVALGLARIAPGPAAPAPGSKAAVYQAANNCILQLRRSRSILSGPISLADYERRLRDLKVEFDSSIEGVPGDSALKQYLNGSMQHYVKLYSEWDVFLSYNVNYKFIDINLSFRRDGGGLDHDQNRRLAEIVAQASQDLEKAEAEFHNLRPSSD